MKELKKLPLNIQFFADGGDGGQGDGGNGGQTQETITKEEYDKLKASFDKTASELANLKKQQKEKLSEDEKKKQEQEELATKLADYESKFEDFALKEELSKDTIFNNEEINKIVAKKGDKKEMLKEVMGLLKTKIEDAKKQAVADFMKTSNVGGQGGGNNDKTTEQKEIEELAKSHSKQGESKFFK